MRKKDKENALMEIARTGHLAKGNAPQMRRAADEGEAAWYAGLMDATLRMGYTRIEPLPGGATAWSEPAYNCGK